MSEDTTAIQDKPEELTDILLVLDKEKKKIQAVKSIDENGNMKTVAPTKRNAGEFMRVDRGGDVFSNFFSNFFEKLKNPNNFSFFKIPSPIAFDVSKELQKQVKTPTPEGEQLVKQYEVKTENNMAQENNVAGAEQAAAKPDDQPRFKVEDIDWDTMNNLGLSKEYLEKKNLLEPLLRGFKSNVLVPISINLGGVAVRTDARIWLTPGEDGKIITALQGVRREPNLNYEFFGHKFTDEDKKNLLETGNMGRVVNLTNTKTGENIPSLISVDKLTNQLVALRTERIRIPDEFIGVKLDESQKKALAEGKAIFLEGMISQKGKEFSANVQFNADKRYPEPLFEKRAAVQKTAQEMPDEFRKIKLNEEQKEKLKNNQPAYIDGLIDRKGQPYQGYIIFNRNTGKFDFSWPNQNKAQPDEAHRAQVAVNSEGKTNESTKKIDKPLKPGQSNPKNKSQQDQQQTAPKTTKSKGVKL